MSKSDETGMNRNIEIRVNTMPTMSIISNGGKGVIGIGNAEQVPTVNPAGGGVLFVEEGALKYRGSNGTVTVIALA